VSKGFLFGG